LFSQCHFIFSFTAGPVKEASPNGHTHSHDHHGQIEHGHTHEIMENPGTFCGRDKPLYRTDWKQVNVPCVKVEYIGDFTSR
jgi:hypothetical protein